MVSETTSLVPAGGHSTRWPAGWWTCCAPARRGEHGQETRAELPQPGPRCPVMTTVHELPSAPTNPGPVGAVWSPEDRWLTGR
jgi:hypothetical protein